MAAIYIKEDDVFSFLNIEKAIELVEEAFMNYSNGSCYNMPRRRLRIKKVPFIYYQVQFRIKKFLAIKPIHLLRMV